MENRNQIKNECKNYLNEIQSLKEKVIHHVYIFIYIIGISNSGFSKRIEIAQEDIVRVSVDGKDAWWHWRECACGSR